MQDYQPKRAAILARISDARDDDVAGVERQKADCRALAADLGWTVSHVFEENDTSAFKRRMVCRGCLKLSRECRCHDTHERVPRTYRPEFRRLLQMLKAGEVDGLLAYDLDRIARDPRDLQDLADVVEDKNIPVEAKGGRIRTADDLVMAQIMVVIANKASKDTRRRVARKREEKAQNGQHGGGRRSFGYGQPTGTKHPSGRPVLDLTKTVPSEAKEIRSWASQILAGVSLKSIAADLRERQVPTVTGGKWDTASVRDILLRPSLAGLVVYRQREAAAVYKERNEPVPYDAGVLPGVRGRWEPVLDEGTWRAVAEKLTEPGRRTNGGAGAAPKWLGSLIYRCGPCAAKGVEETVSVSGKRDRHNHASYLCRSDSGHLRRSQQQVDEWVTDVLIARLAQPDAADLFAPKDAGVDRKALGAERAKCQRGRERLLRLVADEAIDEGEARRDLARLAKRITEIDGRLSAAAERSPLDGVPVGADVETVRKAWAALPLGTKRLILRALMDVTLLNGRPGRVPLSDEYKAHRAACDECQAASARRAWQDGCAEGARLHREAYFDPSTVVITWRG